MVRKILLLLITVRQNIGPKGTSTAFTQGTISENLKNADLAFRMALQGSSTKGYRVKNFDLEVYAKKYRH